MLRSFTPSLRKKPLYGYTNKLSSEKDSKAMWKTLKQVLSKRAKSVKTTVSMSSLTAVISSSHQWHQIYAVVL